MASTADAAGVDGAGLMAHVAAFARYVKLSGTPEERESLRYVEACLSGWGFRTTVLTHDAYISLPGPARLTVGGREFEAITHSFAVPTPPGGLRAELADLADGEDRDLRGRILLVDGIAGAGDAGLARRTGAAALIHASPDDHRHEMCISPVWGNPSPDDLAALPAVPVLTVAKADGAALRDRIRAGTPPLAHIEAEVDTGWRPTPILVAELDAPAGGADAPFVLLSGHHDTWYYGVMDNGAANATMLEVARLCALRRDGWRRGLRLCFWSGHSHGRYSGSAWYADACWSELDRRCLAHVNIDSTGGIGAEVLGDAMAMSCLHALAADAVRVGAGQDYRGRRKNRSSDDSFGGIGIPSMFGPLSEQPPGPARLSGLGWWWHTPHDLIDRIDEANLVRDTRVVLHAVARLLEDPVPPVDLEAIARDLISELESIDAALARRLSLAGLLAEARRLLEGLGRFRQTGPGRAGEALDRAVIAATRALVPIDYTRGDRFAHDPALPAPAWPALEPLRRLAASPAGSDDERFARVAATRARNRIAQAVAAAERAIAD